MRNLGILALAAALGGCASSAADIAPAYVSPVTYQSYTCQQLGMEAQSVSAQAAALSGAQDKQRTNDAVATGVAIVVFWPAAFLIHGDRQTAAQLAQMKGQMVAIQQASIAKKCNIHFQSQPAPTRACPQLEDSQAEYRVIHRRSADSELTDAPLRPSGRSMG